MISAARIDEITGLVEAHGLDESAVIELRAAFPELHFTYCQDDDISSAEPVRESERFNVYLVDGRGHCLCFTRDAEAATGVVLAGLE